MAQTSFPIREQPLTDQQWGQVTEGFGSGILAKGSEPYGIPNGGLDNANNTARLSGRGADGQGRAVVAGFYHRYDADIILSLPAVTTTTTYYIALTYDPTKHADAAGPVSVTVTTSRLTDGGKVSLPIYRVTRRANELLTAATIVDERAFITPKISVRGAVALPPAASVLTYTVATDWLTGQQWQMKIDGTWQRIGGTAVVAPLAMSGWGVTSSGVMVTPLNDGTSQAVMEVTLSRTGADFTQGTSFITHGTLLPNSVRNPARGGLYIPAMVNLSPGVVYLDLGTGQILARLYSGSVTMGTGSRIAFQASWLIPTS